MKITRCQIEGFGHFADRDLHFDPGMTVVTGPNEAGKTTLLEFLAYVLFDFRRGRSHNRYEPLRGGRHGGRLFLDTNDGKWVIERFAGSKPLIRRAESADILPLEPVEVFGGADRDLFRTVFAFSLAELQSLKNLATERVREKLFSAGVAGAGRSVQSAVGDLDGYAKELWRVRADCRLKEVWDALAASRERLREARSRAKEYPNAQKELDDQRVRLKEIRSKLREASCKRERIATLTRSWPAWSRASEATAELEKLEQCPLVDSDSRATVERLQTRLEGACEALAEIEADVGTRAGLLASLETEPHILKAGQKIRRLTDEAVRVAELEDESGNVGLALEEGERAVHRTAQGLGLDPDSAAVRNLRISDEMLEPLRDKASELDSRATELTSAKRTLVAEISDLERRLDIERRDAEAFTPDQGVLDRADAIRKAVVEAREWEDAARRAKNRGNDASAAEAERDRRLRQFGLDPSHLPSMCLDHEAQQRLRSGACMAVERSREVDEARGRLEDLKRELRDLVPAATAEGRETLEARRRAISSCRAALRDLDRLAISHVPVSPGFTPPLLAAIGVLAIASVVAAALLWHRLGTMWGLTALGVGLLTLGLLILGLWPGRTGSAAALSAAGSDTAIRRRLGLAAGVLGLQETPTYEEVERVASQLEIDLRALERAEEAERVRLHAEQRRTEQEREVVAASGRAELALADWQRSLEGFGLASAIAPEHAERTLAALADAQEAEERRQIAVRDADEARHKVADLEKAIDELAACVGRRAEGAPTGIAEALTKRLEEAEAAAAERRRRTDVVREGENELKRLQERVRDLEDDQVQLAGRYESLRSTIARSGLAVVLEQDSAVATIAMLGDLARATVAWRKARVKAAQDGTRIQDFLSSIAALAEELSLAAPSGTVECLDAVRASEKKLAEAERLAERARTLTEELQQARDRLANKRSFLLRIEEELKKAVAAAGAPDVSNLRRWADLTVRRDELERQQNEARRNLRENSGSLACDESFRRELATGRRDEWQASLPEIEASIAHLKAEEEEAVRQETRMVEELARIGADDTITRLNQEIATAKERERELQSELLVLQIAQALLTESLDQFRRERQPAVLSHASDLFRSITGGQYVRVEGCD